MNQGTINHIQVLLNEEVENRFSELQRNICQSNNEYPENDVKVRNSLSNYAIALRTKSDFDDYVDEMNSAEDEE